MDRLTKMYKAGRYGLMKVKDNEQEVDSPYPNTLLAILECFQQLGAYEDTELTPAEITAMKDENARLRAELEAAKADLAKAKPCGCCVHQYSGECILEECMDPCSAFIEGGKWEWRGVPANTPAQGATDETMGGHQWTT